jgi:hypothetical protein
MYNYAADWMTSRAAWISSKWFSEYTPSAKIGDVDGDGEVTVMDATLVQKYIASLETLTDSQLNVADGRKSCIIQAQNRAGNCPIFCYCFENFCTSHRM